MSGEEETYAPADGVPSDAPLNDVRVETDSVSTTRCQECGCEIDVQGIACFDEVECPDCSARVPVPAKLGPFLLTKMLGAGGMGAVYIGHDEALGRKVAIKVMLKSLGEDKEFIEAFKREAQAAAKINHPNICQIYSFGTEKGQPYIVMELISGTGFDSLVEADRKIDQALVMQVGHDIARGLAAANEENLLHGDIKPENILLDEKLNAKLVDFGIASVAGQASDGIWGTPYYIAPEKILRQKPDGRSDMYSLGATLYHALAGSPPFEGNTPVDVVKARLTNDPKPLNLIRPDLKPEVVQVIARMLQRTPGMRHPTYTSLVSDLAKCVEICGGRKKSLSKLKKTGRIMVGKRGKSATGAPITTQKKMPQIRVPKKSIVISSNSSSGGTSTAAPKTSRPPTPKKPASKTPLIIFLIIVALAVVGGGGFFLVDKHKKELAAKREVLAYNNAVADMGKELAGVSNAVASIAKLVASASGFPSAASNAVLVVCGEELAYPSPAAVAPAKPSKEPESTKKEAPAKPKPKDAPKMVVDEKGREAPAGFAPPEKDDPPAPEEPPPESSPAAIDIPPPPVSDAPIKKLARQLIDECILLGDKLVSAEEMNTAALTAYEEGRNSHSSLQAAAKCKVIKDMITEFETLQKNTKVVLDRAAKSAQDIEDMRAAFVKAQKDKQQAEEEAERARSAAEEAERKEAEHLALIATEQALVASAHEQAIGLYKSMSFADGVNVLKQQAKDLSTDEAKEIMDNHLEQGKLLVEMKEYLANQMTKDPFAWGWIVDGRAVDIVKADVKKITTRTREAGWDEVTVQQMLHLFKKYMTKSSVPLKTLARQNLAAAVYCSLHKGGEVVSASYADTATMHDPTLTRLVPKVLPQPEE